MRQLLVIMVALTLLSGCGSSDSTSSPTDTSRPPVGGDFPPLTAEPATIITVGNPAADCDANVEPGDCYLPLNLRPSTDRSSRAELVSAPDAHCPFDNAPVEDQSACWPQPTDEVEVVCQERGAKAELYYGVSVLRKQFADSSAADAAFPLPDSSDKVVLFTLGQFVTLKDPSAEPVDCPF